MTAKRQGSALAAAAAAAGLLAACGGSSASAHHAKAAQTTNVASTTTSTASPRVINECKTAEQCLSPQTLRTAYGVSPLLARGIDGRGQTVVLPEVADPPASARRTGGGYNVVKSLAAYDARYHLPSARLSMNTRLAPSADPVLAATPEELLDVEMVHALAPGAAIRVELVGGKLLADIPSALRDAVPQGDIISISYGTGERCFDTPLGALQGALRTAADRHVTVLASAGDRGAAAKTCPGHPATGPGVGIPGADPLVTSVGGTELTVDPRTGAYEHETVWNSQATDARAKPEATGGGFSTLFARPSYQDGVRRTTARRGVPDVSFDASDTTGPAVLVIVTSPDCAHKSSSPSSSTTTAGSATPRSTECGEIVPEGGTSVATPAWAGIVALADQYAHRPLGFIDPALYRIGSGPHYHQAFHDITTGNNSVTLAGGEHIAGFSAGPGWDPVTGWGSPDAQQLVPLLAREARPDDGRDR